MKNIHFALLFIILTTTAAKAQVSYEAGLNMAKLSIKSGGADFSTKFTPGAAFGLVADIPMAEHVFFEPAGLFEMAGTKITLPEGEYTIYKTDLQLNLEYKTGERCGPRFFIGIGPVINFYTSGDYDITTYGGLPPLGGSLKFGADKEDNLKSRGFGVGLNFGYLFKRHFYFRVHYQMGLSNLNPYGDADNSIKPSEVGINLGYTLTRCRHKGNVTGFFRNATNHWRGLSKGRYSRKPRYPLKPW